MDGNGEVSYEVAELSKAHDSTSVELRAVSVEGKTTQPEDDSALWTPDDTIAPPEDLLALRRLTEDSWVRSSCIESIARNTVGLGWDVVADKTHQAETSDTEAEAIRHHLDALSRRDVRLGKPSFKSLLEAVKTDEQECGNGYIEVSRDRRSGKIDGLFYCPGPYVRRKKDRTGYVVGTNRDLAGADHERTDYFNFGEKVAYDSDGHPQPRLHSGGLWATNELIHLRVFTTQSRDYGLPRDVELAIEYLAAKLVDEWAVGFFDSSGVPPTVFFVAGQENRDGERIRFTVPQETINRIDQTLKPDSNRRARVAIVPVPPGTQVQAETLAQLSERDLTFGEFKKQHRRNVGGSFRISPIFYGDVDDAGRYTAEVQRALTLEQVFDPEQVELEDRLWQTLIRDLGYPEYKLRFKRLAIEGDAVRRESANTGAEVGAVTLGEWREAHGFPPLEWDGTGEDPNAEILHEGQPRGAEDRVGVRATEDTRGLRPGLAGRVAKAEDDHEHGEPYVDEIAEELAKELSDDDDGDDE